MHYVQTTYSKGYRDHYFRPPTAQHGPRRRLSDDFEIACREAFDLMAATNMDGWSNLLLRLLRGARHRSRMRGRTEVLSLDDLKAMILRQGFRCAVTRLPLRAPERAGRAAREPFSPSLDRIDCKRGYEADNVRVVALVVNCALGQWGLAPVRKMAYALVRSDPDIAETNADL